MLRVSGTLDGRYAGRQRGRPPPVSAGVNRSRCTRTGGLLRTTRSEPTPNSAPCRIELGGGAAGQAGHAGVATESTAAVGRGTWSARRAPRGPPRRCRSAARRRSPRRRGRPRRASRRPGPGRRPSCPGRRCGRAARSAVLRSPATTVSVSPGSSASIAAASTAERVVGADHQGRTGGRVVPGELGGRGCGRRARRCRPRARWTRRETASWRYGLLADSGRAGDGADRLAAPTGSILRRRAASAGQVGPRGAATAGSAVRGSPVAGDRVLAGRTRSAGSSSSSRTMSACISGGRSPGGSTGRLGRRPAGRAAVAPAGAQRAQQARARRRGSAPPATNQPTAGRCRSTTCGDRPPAGDQQEDQAEAQRDAVGTVRLHRSPPRCRR